MRSYFEGRTPNVFWRHRGLVDVHLLEGDAKTCTVTNTFVVPTVGSLTVQKVVDNTGGGTSTVGDFTLRIDGAVVTSGAVNVVNTGAHTVSEDDPGPSCTTVISGHCASDGSVSLSVRLTFRAPDRTLTDAEVQQAVDAVVAALATAHDARLR